MTDKASSGSDVTSRNLCKGFTHINVTLWTQIQIGTYSFGVFLIYARRLPSLEQFIHVKLGKSAITVLSSAVYEIDEGRNSGWQQPPNFSDDRNPDIRRDRGRRSTQERALRQDEGVLHRPITKVRQLRTVERLGESPSVLRVNANLDGVNWPQVAVQRPASGTIPIQSTFHHRISSPLPSDFSPILFDFLFLFILLFF